MDNIVENKYENGQGVITFSDAVTEIPTDAFRSCRSLTSIILPESLTMIGNSAFCRCSSLTSIAIPDGVTMIGYETFYGCSSLTSLYSCVKYQ